LTTEQSGRPITIISTSSHILEYQLASPDNLLEGKTAPQVQESEELVKKNWSIVRIFLAKKIFTVHVDQVCNWRNDLFLGSSRDQVQGTFRTKPPAQVMVLGMVTSD
jgi:hypothetical protein